VLTGSKYELVTSNLGCGGINSHRPSRLLQISASPYTRSTLRIRLLSGWFYAACGKFEARASGGSDATCNTSGTQKIAFSRKPTCAPNGGGERSEGYTLGIARPTHVSAPLCGDLAPVRFKIYAHFLLRTITTTSARGPMVGESASTPHVRVRVDVGPIASVTPRQVGSLPPTPDLGYGDEVRSGELVIPRNPDSRRWRLIKAATACSPVPKARTLLQDLLREPQG